jgi:hypothetical protein
MVIDERRPPARERSAGTRASTRGCGCATPLVVLIVGLALALFAANVGLGVSVRVPFTHSNLSVAGSVGHKDLATDTLPAYIAPRLGANDNFINQSITLTIGPAEGTSVIVLGRQPGAPVVDLRLDFKQK